MLLESILGDFSWEFFCNLLPPGFVIWNITQKWEIIHSAFLYSTILLKALVNLSRYFHQIVTRFTQHITIILHKQSVFGTKISI